MQQIQEDLAHLSHIPWLSNQRTNVYVLRLDNIHPLISGNKWYKLRYYLKEAKEQHKKVVTFGGAYSNHILATAAACKLYGLECAGIIRGEAPARYSETLTDAASHGMELHFISREAYAAKQVPETLTGKQYYVIPEGGYGHLGMLGAATIPFPAGFFDAVCCATGTGTMMAGLICASGNKTKVTGFSVLKNHNSLTQEITALLPENVQKNFSVNDSFHFGGYARYNAELIRFMNQLYTATGIPTDFVYTGKLFYGVKALLATGFGECRNLLTVHSGGLQGNRSLPKGTLIF
ncbi:1-aminocyclopropane-1-carboxylate deaminase [Niabella ginsenosidivorans]|uniref:1-aminocyclopropane-1-carboxylate deaminase n=1 Tax=Niabella ginsenosidivorans TaxID=1176587 RepID=A0A1A9HZ74_9BACT|nr:pyridoxal-phosphate dependent enzyme [Niabella ginsenosidivorans]ANH80707.1 1-aminocyclopropane-1-carboxylate deaminase [Niabella ginsenosidivorans]